MTADQTFRSDKENKYMTSLFTTLVSGFVFGIGAGISLLIWVWIAKKDPKQEWWKNHCNRVEHRLSEQAFDVKRIADHLTSRP